MRPTFEVLVAGSQTTVQDLGRPGHLADGIAPSGAFDAFALQAANLLVGNDTGTRFLSGRQPGAAGLEMLIIGPRLRVLRDAVVAVTGAEVAPHAGERPLPMWQTARVHAGDVLRFAPPAAGARAYLAVDGGIEVPAVLGSRATNVRGRLGGLDGRPLRRDDVLSTAAATQGPGEVPVRAIPAELRPALTPPWDLGVVLGPQDELFESDSVSTFLSHTWQLSPTADRMGCRFVGPPLRFRPRPAHLAAQAGSDPSNIVDDVIPVGGIQVPSGLEPIAMGVDGPSIGGYAKIATVVSAHLGRLAQIRPGEDARFRAMTTDEALAALRERDRRLHAVPVTA